MIRPIITVFAPLCVFPWSANAQDNKLEVEGSIRTRVEVIDGQFRPQTADGGALFLRTLLRAEYDAGPIRIIGELQDARVYFERQPTSIGATEVDAFEPIQANVIGEIGQNTELQVGRMTMDWGSRRFVSRQNFRNSTNAFTGARFDWRPTKNEGVTLFWTMPQDRLPNDSKGVRDNEVELNRERLDQQFFGARGVKANVVEAASVEGYVYRLIERDAANFATRDRALWTSGFRMLKAPAKGAFDFEVEAAGQWGATRATTAATDRTDLDVKAYFVHASVGHSFAAPWSPRVVISYDRASGDRRSSSYGRFDTLFGARIFEFGPSSLYGLVGRANLSSPEVRVEVKPDKRMDGYVAVRPLWLESATDTFSNSGVRDVSGSSGRYGGTQFDVRARYWLTPDLVRVAAGVAVLAKGRFLESAPRAPANGNTHFGYLELTYGF